MITETKRIAGRSFARVPSLTGLSWGGQSWQSDSTGTNPAANIDPRAGAGSGATGAGGCPAGYAPGPTGDCIQTAAYRLQAVLSQYTQAAMLGQYGTPPPTIAQMQTMLQQQVTNTCAETMIPCDGTEQALVASLLSSYSSWLAGQSQNQSQQVGGSRNDNYSSSPSTTLLQTPLNVLDHVAPKSTQFRIAEQTTALAPPTSQPVVTAQSVANAQTQSAAPAMNKTAGETTTANDGTAPATNIPSWAYLAAAAAGILLLTNMGKN